MAIDLLPSNPFDILKSFQRKMYLKINELINSVNGGSVPFTIYEAQLSQSGTNAPVAIELLNTLGGAVTTSRVSSGRYNIESTGLFTEDKTIVFISNVDTGGNVTINVRWIDDSTIQIYALVLNTSTGVTTEVDDLIPRNALQVHVYP